MSLSKVFFGSGGRDEWIWTSSTGASSYTSSEVAVSDKYIWVSIRSPYSDFGRTNEVGYLTALDMRGSQVFEKVLGDPGDVNDVFVDTSRGPALAANPYDQDNVVMGWLISTENKWGISNIGIDGVIDHSAEMGYTSSTFAAPYVLGVASNGDVYAINGTTSNDGRTFLLDRSNATPYAAAVWKYDMAEFDYIIDAAVDPTDDAFVVLGRLLSTDYKCCLKTMSVAGTVTYATNLYEFGDAGDDSYGEGLAVDSSGNRYVLWRNTDTSGPANYAYMTKLSATHVHQWTKRYTGVFQGSVCLSPDETSVYAFDPTNGGGTVVSFATSDGTVEWENDITSTGNSLGSTKLVSNSDSVFIVGNTGASGNDKLTILKLLPSSLETGGTFDAVTVTPQSPTTWSSVTPTLASGSKGRSSVTATPVDGSSLIELVALDTPTTTSLKEV